ncbi:phospholipid hydroperoxide glutathione peroxidase Gtpx [Arctopsyche grandis]|uniref:phospholipid hydroperoxide glutathione peroxidase Gtpx n=1 Tax=Arctopsyche grandis TaxID=121162 RepID=UPI00406D9996
MDSPPADAPKMDTPVKTKSTEETPSSPVSSQPESPTSETHKNAKSVYEFTVKDKDGQDVSLEKYRGKVLLIVNIASKCGYTPSNNKELTELKEKYESKGLRILGFPCNQFMGQEPGNNEEIMCFLAKKNVDFGDVFSKCEVNGENTIPLYRYLKHKMAGTMGNFIKWNYTKFIVDKEGQPVERHGPNVQPSSLAANIEKYL